MSDDQQRAIRLVSLAYARRNGIALGHLLAACRKYVRVAEESATEDAPGMDSPSLAKDGMKAVEEAAVEVGAAIDALRELAGMRDVLATLNDDPETFGFGRGGRRKP